MGDVAIPRVTKLGTMRKGVKVRRVVRRFELWPVAKVAFFFHVLCYLLTLGVLTGVWFVADRMGTINNLERLITRLGWDEFEVHGDVLFRAALAIGASLVLVATIATVTLAFFYNMLSGIFGGLVLSVLQEHTDGSSRTRRQRRKAARAVQRARRVAGKKARKNPGPDSTPASDDPSPHQVSTSPAPIRGTATTEPRPTPLPAPALHPPLRPKPTPTTQEFLDDTDFDNTDLDNDATWTDHLRPRNTDSVSSSGLPGTSG